MSTEYTVEVTVRTRRPLTEQVLFDVAELGGVAVGAPGERHLETTLTFTAADVREAAERAIETLMQRVAGIVVAVEAMTTGEADRRLAEKPKLVGVTEVADMLGISRQRVSMLSQRKDFPTPLERLASGPIWRSRDLSTFAAGWRRQPGRPRKDALMGGRDNRTGQFVPPRGQAEREPATTTREHIPLPGAGDTGRHYARKKK